MTERIKYVGGLSGVVVDEKIIDIVRFDTPGGITQNILASVAQTYPHVAYAGCVGYEKNADLILYNARPITGFHIEQRKGNTGVVTYRVTHDGKMEVVDVDIGNGHEVIVPEEFPDIRTLVTDIISLRSSSLSSRIEELLLRRNRPQISLNLGGTTKTPNVVSLLNGLPVQPESIFGNYSEYTELLKLNGLPGEITLDNLRNLFPNTQLLVVTDGSNNVHIVLRDTISSVPVLKPTLIMDESGAGDTLHGVTLGHIADKNLECVSMEEVTRAVTYGIQMATQVMMSFNSRPHARPLIINTNK